MNLGFQTKKAYNKSIEPYHQQMIHQAHQHIIKIYIVDFIKTMNLVAVSVLKM